MSTRLRQPVTGGSFSSRNVRTATLLRAGDAALVRTLVAAITLTAPAAPGTNACFAVTDQDGNASANPITINGNGTLIDGAATAQIAADGAEAVYYFDRGQWRSLVVDREIEGEPPGRLVSQPFGGAPAGSGGGSSGAVDLVQVSDGTGGFAAAANVKAGNGFISIGAAPSVIGDERHDGSVDRVFSAFRYSDALDYKLYELLGGALFLGSTSFSIRLHGSSVTLYAPSSIIGIFRPDGSGFAMTVEPGGIQFGNGGIDVGGGVDVLGIDNATTVPTTDPTAGGILYEEAGAFKHRGSGGTITTMAPA